MLLRTANARYAIVSANSRKAEKVTAYGQPATNCGQSATNRHWVFDGLTRLAAHSYTFIGQLGFGRLIALR
jgi:hypothetical protein